MESLDKGSDEAACLSWGWFLSGPVHVLARIQICVMPVDVEICQTLDNCRNANYSQRIVQRVVSLNLDVSTSPLRFFEAYYL